jgi:hypothetical protein
VGWRGTRVGLDGRPVAVAYLLCYYLRRACLGSVAAPGLSPSSLDSRGPASVVCGARKERAGTGGIQKFRERRRIRSRPTRTLAGLCLVQAHLGADLPY